jgi:hypothetical protein
MKSKKMFLGHSGQVRFVCLVHLIRLETDNICLFLPQTNRQTTNFHLHDEQNVNRLRKIAWASFPFETFQTENRKIYI